MYPREQAPWSNSQSLFVATARPCAVVSFVYHMASHKPGNYKLGERLIQEGLDHCRKFKHTSPFLLVLMTLNILSFKDIMSCVHKIISSEVIASYLWSSGGMEEIEGGKRVLKENSRGSRPSHYRHHTPLFLWGLPLSSQMGP